MRTAIGGVVSNRGNTIKDFPSVLSALRYARLKISNPADWIQGDYYVTGNGGRKSCAGNACLRGIVRDQDFSIKRGRIIEYLLPLYNLLPEEFKTALPDNDQSSQIKTINYENSLIKAIVAWNDSPTTTHQMVLDVFDRAIAAEEERHGKGEEEKGEEEASPTLNCPGQ